MNASEEDSSGSHMYLIKPEVELAGPSQIKANKQKCSNKNSCNHVMINQLFPGGL